MLNCPVCNAECGQEKDSCSICKDCQWDLELVLITSETSLTQEEEAKNSIIKKAIASHKKLWDKFQSQQPTKLLVETATEPHLEDLEKIKTIVKKEVKKALSDKEKQEKNNIDKILNHHPDITEIKNSKLDKSEFETESKKCFDKHIKDYFDGQLNSWTIEQINKSHGELEKKINTYDRRVNDNKEAINTLEERVKKVKSSQDTTQSLLDYNNLVNSPGSKTSTHLEANQDPNNEISHYKITVTTEELQLVRNYNSGSFRSLEKIAEVSETSKSISDRSLGASQTVILEEKSRGTYEIVKEGAYHYLVPSKSFRITDSNYQTVQGLFECRNYQKGYSERFELVQPAKVITLSNNQNWQLQEQGRGILEFKVDCFQFTDSAKVSL